MYRTVKYLNTKKIFASKYNELHKTTEVLENSNNQTCNLPQMEFLDCCIQGKDHVPGNIHQNPPNLAVCCAHNSHKMISCTHIFRCDF